LGHGPLLVHRGHLRPGRVVGRRRARHQLSGPPGNRGAEPVLTKAVRRLGEVATVTMAVDDAVAGHAVRLAEDFGPAIGQELDIAREHQLHRAIDAAEALGELRGRLRRDVRDGRTPGGAGGGVALHVRLEFGYCTHGASPWTVLWVGG